MFTQRAGSSGLGQRKAQLPAALSSEELPIGLEALLEARQAGE